MLMRSTTTTSAMMLTTLMISSRSAETSTTLSPTIPRLSQELPLSISRRKFLMMLRISSPSSDSVAKNRESESVNSSEILISSEVALSLKLSSELVST